MPDPVVTAPWRHAPFGNGGAMGALIRAHDWSRSPLGPVENWSAELVNAVALMLPAQAEIVLFWGADYCGLYNDAYAPTIGNKHPRVLGRPAREGWNELWDDLEPLLAHVRATGETYSAKDRPFRIERAGYLEEVFFDISYSAVPSADGTVGGVLCIVAETTARVRAARAVAADRARLSEMFDLAPGFMAVLREPGHVFELANASYRSLVGGRDVVGLTLAEALPELAEQGFAALLDEVVASARAYRGTGVPITLRHSPDQPMAEHVLDFIYQPLTDAEGAVTGIFVEGVDVTERHRAEQALALSRESLELATDTAEIGTWDLDLRTNRLVCSRRTNAMFGIAPETDLSLVDFLGAVHPADVDRVREAFAAAIDPARRALYEIEYRVIGREDGVTRWVAAKGRGYFDEHGHGRRAIGTTIDITRRKAEEQQLAESEERFRLIADSAPALIWVSDAAGTLVFANRWFDDFLGISPAEMERDGWLRIIPAEDRARIGAARDDVRGTPQPFGGELRVITKSGEYRWVSAQGSPRFVNGVFAGHVGCAVDVTERHLAGEVLERRIEERTAELSRQIAERQRVEETLHQMQRLEAIGQLTSGVAHDFNNLLTVVLGNVDQLTREAERADMSPRSIQRLEHVRTAAQRGATLTQQLLAFSRRQRLEAKAIDLNETVCGMTGLLGSTLGRGIEITTQLEPKLWPALVDPTQIELIILNLAINARDAMPVGGVLKVGTANVTLGSPERPEEPTPGDYVVVSVHDTGTGMDEATLARAFEPFFTTKEVGKGSGLGLAQVFGFAKQSGGGVRIATRSGDGTTVCVYLPRAAAVHVAEQVAAAAPRASGIAGRTVLVLDDEDAVRDVTADVLREAGCRVIEAADGRAALTAIARERGIEGVIADFAMPGMNGVEFARRARKRRPDLPVLFVTGFADLTAIENVPEDRIVRKPFAREALVERVRQMLADTTR